MTLTLKSLVTFAAALPFVVAVPAVKRDDVSFIKEKTYDYVIVGGGLTGLVVAHRLSEQKNRKFHPTQGFRRSANAIHRFCSRFGGWPNHRGY
jgi:hypothetical protein